MSCPASQIFMTDRDKESGCGVGVRTRSLSSQPLELQVLLQVKLGDVEPELIYLAELGLNELLVDVCSESGCGAGGSLTVSPVAA